ncbi:hypothetical protein BAE44_0023710 [Dichanthelium oligosanthes]|uniref:GYF domain-containing protein n=1 Tax=Dichanthelium oligosanthes TaxID=888268 RepID=A0A1E5UQZ1_9POAL|nr:hypothetical protein BAE44_0023710 [Dichanthelium oligosanthes]
MAERKVDRPAALGKEGLSLGIEEDRAAAAAMGFVDDSKDQQHLDNSIPLSPQWLYAKPADGKISLPHGSSLEPTEREVRMLEGTVDRKERRRNVFDADSGLRWLEEERETSLLGRRERKKEVERDVDNRKIDRRPDSVSARDNTDSRAPPTSERWNDGSTRNLGNEGRRDGKWSTRWGPDDKEKDSRSEKKVDAEKDEAHAEKQTFTGRLLSESDSRDKWRPRHRQESHSVGTATYRAAPGFGSEKGRVKDKDSNVGFAPGRGRGNPNSVTSFSRPSSAGPIGAPAVHGRSAKAAFSFRYPRGKLLDIYRQKNMMSSFDDAKLEEIPSITLSTSAKPLAFVAPNTVEEALLEDIRKGKVISSEGSNATGNKKERTKELEEPASGIDDNKDKVAVAFGGLVQEGSSGLISEKDAFYDNRTLSSGVGTSPPKRSVEENAGSNEYGISGIQGLKTDEAKSSADHDLSTKLPDASNTLFDVPPFEHHSESPMPYQNNDMDTKAGGHASYPEELTLYYLDPQGGVQGPFLGADIISWYEDGYFGLELPVRLSQAPDDVPFRPLVEVMPHLGQKPQTHPPALCDESAESLDSAQSKFEAAIPASASSGKSDQASKWDSESNAVDPKRGDHEASLPSRTGWLSSPETGKDIANISNRQQLIPESVTQDAEEVLYTGRPNSSMGQSVRDLENDHADFQLASRDPHSGVGEANLPQHDVPRESDLSPLGLLWSELEGMHPKQPLSSNVLGVSERRNPKPTTPKDIPPVNMRHGQLSRMNEASSMRDEWPGNFGRLDSMSDANIPGRITQVESEHHLNFEEQLLLQQIRREQLQKEQMMARNSLEFTGPEHHNDMLDVLSRPNQRHMTLEQQILLGLQHEQLQSQQQLANALRQHSGREEERHLSGVWPMDDAAQFIRPGTSPNQGHASRHGHLDLLENLQRSSSFEQHEPLDRSLSLHERLHRGGQGIHSLERSGSLPGGGPVPNPDVINALARHHGLALMSKERNTEQDLSEMIHKKLVLQSQHSLGFSDVPVPASFGRKDHFAQPVVENPLRSPVDRRSFEESLAERSLFAKTGQSAQEGSANLDSLPNSIENSGKYNLRSSSGSILEQKHFLGIDDVQRDFSDITGGRASANHLVGSVNELNRGKKQGSSANLAGDDTNFSEDAVSNWSDTGMSKGSSHSLLKRSTNQHTATSQAVSTDLSTIRLKKAGLVSSDENKMESGVTSVNLATEASIPGNKEMGAYSMPSAANNPDASGPSFSEALKSKKPPLQYDTSESADGGPGGKGAKKKAKKGKQIDPSLLGFKVHSNRIMMGEIVRDD